MVANYFIYQQWRVAIDAQKDMRSQLRAVVTLVNATLVTTNDKDGKPIIYSIFPIFQNFGATRTDRFNAWYSIHYFEGTVPNSMDFTKPWDKLEASDTMIGPSSSLISQPVSVSKEQMDSALRKAGSIILWGHVEYTDVFDPQVAHPIGFCYLLSPTTNTNNGQLTIVLSPYRSDCNNKK